jgi:ADP-L-glycero-D-manno-heptose 6-epimerase
LAELVRDGEIVYTPFPPQLVGKYQSYTEADLTKLRAAGCAASFTPAEEGVGHYVESLISAAQSSP